MAAFTFTFGREFPEEVLPRNKQVPFKNQEGITIGTCTFTSHEGLLVGHIHMVPEKAFEILEELGRGLAQPTLSMTADRTWLTWTHRK